MLDRILTVVMLLGRDARESLARMGLTESRAHVLWEVERRGPCTQRTLADALKVTPRTITTLVDALVQTGFVIRAPHPSDRRATLITFTPLGQDTARALVEGHQRLARDLFERLSPEVLEGFDAGLAHVVEQLQILTSSSGEASSGRSTSMRPHPDRI